MSENHRVELIIEKFNHDVSILSNAINKSSIDWNDEKYEKLSQTISNIAKKSRTILNSSRELERQLKDFERLTE